MFAVVVRIGSMPVLNHSDNDIISVYGDDRMCNIGNHAEGNLNYWLEWNNLQTETDMEKGADTWTMSAETFENCGNFLILEDYAPLF